MLTAVGSASVPVFLYLILLTSVIDPAYYWPRLNTTCPNLSLFVDFALPSAHLLNFVFPTSACILMIHCLPSMPVLDHLLLTWLIWPPGIQLFICLACTLSSSCWCFFCCGPPVFLHLQSTAVLCFLLSTSQGPAIPAAICCSSYLVNSDDTPAMHHCYQRQTIQALIPHHPLVGHYCTRVLPLGDRLTH